MNANNVVKLGRPAPRRKTAASGSYGAVPFSRIAPYAQALMIAVKNDLGSVDFFTREDLLHLEVFDHLSTISRYGYLCKAVSFLVGEGALVTLSRTDLALPAKAKNYHTGSATPLHLEYMVNARRLITGIGRDQLFTVMDVVRKWRSDPHLTTNVKRVITRRCVAALVREGFIRAHDEQTYWMESK